MALFPEKKDDILKSVGYNEDQLQTVPLSVEYFEAWIGDQVIYKFRDKILFTEPHPYWDWKGLKVTTREEIAIKKGQANFNKLEKEQDKRVENLAEGEKSKFGSYLFNYFDRPYPPYVFGTAFAVENRPVGETSLIEQVNPLQEEIDKRKRQISDNTEMMNGQYKIDTRYVTITKTDSKRYSRYIFGEIQNSRNEGQNEKRVEIFIYVTIYLL